MLARRVLEGQHVFTPISLNEFCMTYCFQFDKSFPHIVLCTLHTALLIDLLPWVLDADADHPGHQPIKAG